MEGSSINLNAKVKPRRDAAVIHREITDTIHHRSNFVSIYCNVAGIQIEADNKKSVARIEKVWLPRNDDVFSPLEMVMV